MSDKASVSSELHSTDIVRLRPTALVALFLPEYHVLAFIQWVITPLLGHHRLLLFTVTDAAALFQIFRDEKPTLTFMVPRLLNLIHQRINSEIAKATKFSQTIAHIAGSISTVFQKNNGN